MQNRCILRPPHSSGRLSHAFVHFSHFPYGMETPLFLSPPPLSLDVPVLFVTPILRHNSLGRLLLAHVKPTSRTVSISNTEKSEIARRARYTSSFVALSSLSPIPQNPNSYLSPTHHLAFPTRNCKYLFENRTDCRPLTPGLRRVSTNHNYD